MKYMLLTFGEAATMFETKSEQWIAEMMDVMHAFNADLRASGELIETLALVDGRHAKTVRVVDGVCVATDGPFAEAKESLISYWLVDVESEERAVEIAMTLGQALHEIDPTAPPDPNEVLEVRRVADGPPTP